MIPGAETMESLALRVRAGIEAIVARAGADTRVAAIVHGGVIGEICRQATDSRPFAFVHSDNGSLARLVVLPGGAWLLRSFNERHTSRKVRRMDDATLRRFADLVVGFGANVQPGQIVAVCCEPGKEPLVRAIAESAYRRGAKFVDVQWFDPWVKRARDRARARGDARLRPAVVRRAHARARRDARGARRRSPARSRPACWRTSTRRASAATSCPALKEAGKVVNDRTTNWTIGPCPTPAWAKLVHPDLDRGRGARRSSRSSSCTSAASTRTTRSPPGASARTRSSRPPSA